MSGRAPVWDPTVDELATTMKAAIFTGPNTPLVLGSLPRPEPAAGELLVKVTACGLCHSDLHYMDHGVPTFKTPPLVLGHEISGTVVRVGTGVDQARIGTSVLLAPVTSCGECAMCRTGRENVCARQKMLGNGIDGGFAEYVVAPSRDAFAIPPDVPALEACVIADALTTAFHAVTRRARVESGETVVVVGCGGLGLNVVQVAAMAGARVIAVDIDPRKLGLARELGASLAIDARDGDAAKRVRKETDGGADVAIEAIGNRKTQEQALASVRTGGRLVLLGFAADNMSLPGGRVTYREITVIGTLGCRPIDFPIVLDLVRRGKLALGPLVTHRHTLESINSGFDALRRGEGVRHVVVMP
jgi:alcohol dehydrogenase, propanol-preferring